MIRVLLVHANPFQRVTPVPAYGLERLASAAAGLGASIRIIDPFLTSADPLEEAIGVAREFAPDVIGLGIRVVDDCVPVDRVDGEGPIDVGWLMPEIRELADALRSAAPAALVLAGGAGFSAVPLECLRFLSVEYGVVGAGERAFCEVLERVSQGRSLDGVAGLVGSSDPVTAAYQMTDPGPTQRSALYAPVNAFPVRTRIGCAMQCVYCTASTLLRAHATMRLDDVVDEIERTVASTLERGLPIAPIFFADDEWNLPDEKHPAEILTRLIERGLDSKIRWRAYFNPTPFSDEFCELVKRTNGHVSLTVDSASEPVLTRSQKPFRRRHLEELREKLERHALEGDIGLIFGLPGETEETIRDTVEFVRRLPPSLDIYYSAGARVYPHTPLAEIARAEPLSLYGSGDPSFFEPVVYSSPWPPRELARYLADALAEIPAVRHETVVAYRSGRTVFADAYRAVLDAPDDRGRWRRVLDQAVEPGDVQHAAHENLLACLQIALWHRRYRLAGLAASRLLRQDLPEDVSRARLGASRVIYGVLGTLRQPAGIADAG